MYQKIPAMSMITANVLVLTPHCTISEALKRTKNHLATCLLLF